jgi:hypothetical protein
LLAPFLKHTPSIVATILFGIRAWRDVISRFPDHHPWDSFVPYLSLGCGLVVIWLGMSAVCAGARWATHKLHWALRWVAYVVLVALAIAVPFLLLVPMFLAAAVCPEGCDVGANWDSFVIFFDAAVPPNLVWWPVIGAVTVTGAVWTALVERKGANSLD